MKADDQTNKGKGSFMEIRSITKPKEPLLFPAISKSNPSLNNDLVTSGLIQMQ